MARLNEAPVPAESIDAVKRRFLRQNRDLAKSNSNQSIRIRNLETESSRLLAENLALRERMIQLEAQVEQYQKLPPPNSIYSVKDKLELKIQELGNLVAELQCLHRPSSKTQPTLRSPQARRIPRDSADFPDEDELEGKLPTIREDKYYPRKTLESQELRALVDHNVTDSPVLSPPPIAHFQGDDPIKFDRKSSINGDGGEENALEIEGIPPALAVNLETRRRRRDSQGHSDMRRLTVFHSSPEREENLDTNDEFTQTLKKGSKRKLSARDDDAPQTSNAELAEVAPRTRRTSNLKNDSWVTDQQEKLSSLQSNSLNGGKVSNNVVPLNAPSSPPRKVLGSKSINTDPVISPKKGQKSSLSGGKPLPSRTLSSAKASNRSGAKEPKGKTAPIRIEQIPDLPPIKTVDIIPDQVTIQPKTPALPSLLTPASEEPSAARPESKDTPPPGHFNPSATSQDDQPAGRAARRARAPVNYAEPNLISKMRRPTEKLVDAVHRGDRTSSGVKLEENDLVLTNADSTKIRKNIIKRERDESSDSAWKNLPSAQDESQPEPASPLSRKTTAVKQKMGPIKSADIAIGAPTGSSATISALMSGSAATRKKPTTSSRTLTSMQESIKRSSQTDDGDIFDINDSVPPGTEAKAPLDVLRDSIKVKTARRHSSVPSINSAASSATLLSRGVGSRVGSESKSNAENVRPKTTRPQKSVRISTLQDASDDSANERKERIASRRRSMML